MKPSPFYTTAWLLCMVFITLTYSIVLERRANNIEQYSEATAKNSADTEHKLELWRINLDKKLKDYFGK